MTPASRTVPAPDGRAATTTTPNPPLLMPWSASPSPGGRRRLLGALPLLACLAAACRPPAASAGARALVAAADSAARAAIENERALQAQATPPRSVAVVPLRVEAADTALAPLSYGLADLLIADLARSRHLRVVERVRTDALLRELSVADPERAESAAPRVGRLLGARRVVAGTVTALDGAAIRVDARVADVEDGGVAGGLAASAPLNRIIDAEKELAFRLFDLLGVTLTPAERAAVSQRPTGDLAALLAYSRGVRAEAQRDFTRAAAEYEQALRADPGFMAARANLSGVRGTASTGGSLQRAASIATGAVNASEASVLRTAADAPLTTAQQLVPIVIDVRIP